MAYISVQSGYCTGENPGSSVTQNGGLRMYWELRCYTSAETVTIMGKSYSCAAGSYKLFYKLQGWYGIKIDSSVYLASINGSDTGGYVRFRNGTTNLWSMTGQSTSYLTARCPRINSNSSYNTWHDISDAGGGYYVYPSGLISVTEGSTYNLNLTYNIHMRYNATYNSTVSKTSSSTSVAISGGKFTLTISQGTGTTATVKRGTTTLSNGATIYKNDSLTFTYSTSTGYTIATHTVNGTSRDNGYSWTVTSNATVVTTAALIEFLLTITKTTGAQVVVNRTSSPIGAAPTGILTDGATLYTNDVLTIDINSYSGYIITTATLNNQPVESPYTVLSNITIIAIAEKESLSFAKRLIAIVYKSNNNYSLYIPLIFDGTTWKEYASYRYIETE